MPVPKIKHLHHASFDRGEDFLIFTHIPKSGGTALHHLLADLLQQRYWLHDGKPEQLERIDSALGMGGHHPFGTSPMHRSRQSLVYITMIRHPFERFLSFFRHIKDHPGHHLPSAYPELLAMTPLEFAQKLMEIENLEIANLQTRMLVGPNWKEFDFARRISLIDRHYSVVGLHEQMDLFLYDLSLLLDAPVTQPKRINVSVAPRPETDHVLQEYVHEINREDVLLYEYFENRASKRIAGMNLLLEKASGEMPETARGLLASIPVALTKKLQFLG